MTTKMAFLAAVLIGLLLRQIRAEEAVPTPLPGPLIQAGPAKVLPPRHLAPGPFKPDWDSLAKQYQCPEWFRDAKFGIWAHWSAQCQPEKGDWYARQMYMQGNWQYDAHLKQYGHPTEFGFKDIDNAWHAEHWDPAKLMKLYKAAGAKYFVALANHHDNFDNYDSSYQEWNSVRVGPHKDLIAGWAKAARAEGLRFGVSNHSAHAWHWFQTAYGYDPEGPKAGQRYDGWLSKADGKGKWWEGLDPQELYTGVNLAPPDGIHTIKEMDLWHEKYDRAWTEEPPSNNPYYTDKWFLRAQELVDKYRPDLVYFDDTELPLGQAGLDLAAHYYNSNLAAHHGKLEAVINAKLMRPERRPALVEDYERGSAKGIMPEPWQTDTCLGNWHYDRGVYEAKAYKSAADVVRSLLDIVSRNGNLLLSVPVRGDGSLDELELGILKELADWMAVNGDAVFGTRPWTRFGEGRILARGGMFSEGKLSYTAEDFRFTTKAGNLYATALEQPQDGKLLVKSLATPGNPVKRLSLLGSKAKLAWFQDEAGLHVTLPAQLPALHTVSLKIEGGPFVPAPEAPVPTPTAIPTPAGTVYQAEAAKLSGGLGVAADQEGFLGTGFVNGFYQGFGQAAEFEVTVPAKGSHPVVFHYANGMGSPQVLSLKVNGRFVQKISFAATQDWATWADARQDLALKKGSNRVSLEKQAGDGCVNLDYLLLP